jgi:hypothetical protein
MRRSGRMISPPVTFPLWSGFAAIQLTTIR